MNAAVKKVKLHISLSLHIMNVSNKVLTPPGFIEPIKGAYSQLLEQLLQQHFERMFNSNIFDIVEYFNNNPDVSIDEARSHFNNLSNENAD